MNLHEYQAKEVLKKYGVSISPYKVISNSNEVDLALAELNIDQAVIKVQIHAGGRGKAGGVKLAKTPKEVHENVAKMLNMRIINNQTGSFGVVANKLLISPIVEYKNEYYLGAVIDRENAQAVLIASPEGGMEIEEIAKKASERILKLPIELNGKLRRYQLIRLCNFMGWHGQIAVQGQQLASAIALAFIESDASLLEINPLVLTHDDNLIALDAKMSIDDNALFRHSEMNNFFDPSQLSQAEVRAKEQDLAYIALDGNIGCMVNGAGLAMATMDIIDFHGGKPANFLDVGGGANEAKVAEGFKIILSDSKVKAILVNIFGGIMNCVTLSAGIIAAAAELNVKVPLVVRMEGTNVERGKKMLETADLDIIIASDLTDAANKVVKAANY